MTGYGGLESGAVLAGRYRVERVLGQGGMGIVVQATHLQLHQPVAIKLLLPDVLGDHQIVQRFLREAQAAVRLRGEHVARVIDVGTLEMGAPFMVLEYLDGRDLSCFPRAQLSVGGIIDLVLQACEALAEAHSLGIVHRDIKPANFFITRRPDGAPMLKVLDFGISKLPSTNTQLTATQTVMGTPAYMSPEQMRSSRDVDHRSDIWSLGVVLYELLQGVPPFGGDTFSSMVIKVVNDPLPRLTVRLPGDLDAIVYRCLEKDPERRFQNTAELAQALARYAQSETQAAISVQRARSLVGPMILAALGAGSPQRAMPSTISGAAGAREMLPRRGGRRLIASSAAGAALLGGVIAILASQGGGSESPPVAPAAVTGGLDAAVTRVQPGTVDAGPATAAGSTPAVEPVRDAAPALRDGDVLDGPLATGEPDASASPPQRSRSGGKDSRRSNRRGEHGNSKKAAAPADIDRGD